MTRTSLSVLLAATFLFGCASPKRERVVVLPGPDGRVGTVVVQDKSGETTLNNAYAGVELVSGKAQARTLSEHEVQDRYRTALAAMPGRPTSFTLLFVFDKAQLIPESKATIASILGEFSRRPAPEILVIGHTDKTGGSQYNEELSRRRAEAARDLLTKEGVPANSIEIQWRGDREPIAGAAPQDPRNRRVEVKIR